VFGDEFVDNNCVVINLINANSPMVFDDTMLGAPRSMRANQACIISPFILAGAMSPGDRRGTLTQVLAEVLAGRFRSSCGPARRWCSAHLPRPSRCSPARRPSARRSRRWCSYGAAQLARRLGVPFRTGGSLCGSKCRTRRPRMKARRR
jgi:trimethylamine--corrinoid protein Co-methyltransferase